MFSTKLSDLDDFLTPSQECVKMIIPSQGSLNPQQQTSAKVILDQNMEDEWSIDTSNQQRPNLIKASGQGQTAKVSLSDCLACSGCVTSAETVLIQQHSTEEFLKLFDHGTIDNPNHVVVALSPQSVASLSLFYKDENDLITFKKLQEIFINLGAKVVIDLSLFNLLSLQLSYDEFRENFVKSKKFNEIMEQLNSQHEGMIKESKKKIFSASKQEEGIPLLASECPGWVCYAEKVVGESAFPFMSKVKSPQQLAGCLLKQYLSIKLKICPQQVKIVTVMPCYDKKLEAVRPNFTLQEEFYQSEGDVKEVDTVLATHELVDLFAKQNIDFSQTKEYVWTKEDTDMMGSPSGWGFIELMEQFIEASANVQQFCVASIMNRTSNGYLEYIFRRAAREIFKQEIDPQQYLQFIQGKNKDLNEISLEINGKSVFKFAAAYGFRNIQNVIRNIKRGKCEYDYVELMACPGGCLNGGGQIKPKDFNVQPKELLEALEIRLQNMQVRSLQPFPEQNQSINKLITLMSLFCDNWFKTNFKAISKEVFSTHNLKW